MPARDRTGPEGKGPLTGRGFGACNPNNQNQRLSQRGVGFGRGCRQGRGYGFRNQNTNEE